MNNHDLEKRLGEIDRIHVPESLDHRMERLFDNADAKPAVGRSWRLPVWAAAAAGLVLVASLLIRGGFGPEPMVVEITPDGQLEQFLLGGGSTASTAGTEFFTRGNCSVKRVWPADAPDWDRTMGGDGQ